MSGLVGTSLNDSVNKLPWLGDIPVLGAFFKSTTLDRSDKELIMVVTPHLVRPVAKGVALPKLPGEQFNNKTPNSAYNIFLGRGKFDSGRSEEHTSELQSLMRISSAVFCLHKKK